MEALRFGFAEPVRCHNGVGMCHAFLNRHAEAIVCYNAAISIDPNDARVYHNRSQSYARLARNELAEADRKKAGELRNRMATRIQV